MSDQIRAFDVWKRKQSGEAVRYRCFEDLSIHKFCVQSADFYRLPLSNDHVEQLERQFLELLIEQSPFDRTSAFETIGEAIAAHDASFEWHHK